jgi:hypothetical protein
MGINGVKVEPKAVKPGELFRQSQVKGMSYPALMAKSH